MTSASQPGMRMRLCCCSVTVAGCTDPRTKCFVPATSSSSTGWPYASLPGTAAEPSCQPDPARLWDDPARDAPASAAERRRVVGVIVTTGMHHEAATGDILARETRSEHRISRRTVGGNIERWQIAQVAVAPGQAVSPRSLRIVMRPSGLGGNHRAVLLCGSAARMLVDVEAMQPGG